MKGIRTTWRRHFASAWGRLASSPLDSLVKLTQAERPVFRRAVAAYLEAKKPHKGKFAGPTADEILEELTPTPVRWARLAALVIEVADGPPVQGTSWDPRGR